MVEKFEVLSPGNVYHIFNRANGSEKLFVTEENYHFFLKKFQQHVSPIAEVYCYCLMPNHFHFLLRIKSKEFVEGYYSARASAGSVKTSKVYKTLDVLSADERAREIEKMISKCFSNLYNSYAKAFNKVYNRKGNLFNQNYKRKLVEEPKYLLNLLSYIHRNPLEAKLRKKILDWPFSSYHHYIANRNDFLYKEEVLKHFTDLKHFKSFHLKRHDDNLL